MKLSAILEPLVDAGVDAKTILAAVRAWEAEQTNALEKRRESDRLRQAKHRANSVMSRDVTVTVPSCARVEDNSKTNISTRKKDNTKARDLAAFKAELSTHTDSERIDETVKHRRRKNAALTGHSARLLVGEIQKAGLSISEGLDMCIERNWVTVKLDWLPKQNSPPKPETPLQQMRRLAEEELANQPTQSGDNVVSLPAVRGISGVGERAE